MAFASDLQASRGFAAFSLKSAVAPFATSLRRLHIQRKTVNELSKLSDRELSDIGISRGMIANIAFEASRDA